jgi:hypothetical protein
MIRRRDDSLRRLVRIGSGTLENTLAVWVLSASRDFDLRYLGDRLHPRGNQGSLDGRRVYQVVPGNVDSVTR